MNEIPNDVMKAAESVWLDAYRAFDAPDPGDGHEAATLVIARALLAVRERCAIAAEPNYLLDHIDPIRDNWRKSVAADIRRVWLLPEGK